MPAFGGYGGFPIEFGGEDSTLETEHQALLDALSPGWDVDDPVHSAELFGYATALTIAWAVNRRLESQALALGMLENLTTWEEVLKLRPSPTTPDIERRRRVAGKIRGYAGNTITDIYDACASLLGVNFVGIHTTPPASNIIYWPGVNPGPPGLEWSTNRLRIGVEVNTSGLSADAFNEKRSALAELLDALLPSWMSFTIGAGGGGFVINQGVIGQTFL